MAEEPISLVLERLNRMDEKLGRMEDMIRLTQGDIRSIREEQRGQKTLVAGALHTQTLNDADLAVLRDRVERIERRLELKDGE